MIALSLARSASGGPLHDIHGINVPQRVHLFEETYRGARLGISYPPHNLIEKCLDEDLLEKVRAGGDPARTALILAAGNQIWMHESSRFPRRDPLLDYKLKLPYVAMTQIFAGRLASRFGATGHVSTDGSACASSLKCLMDVINLIENHDFERVVVVAVDDAVSNEQLNIFGEAGASITIEEEEKGRLPSAFDARNGGFRLAQGAAVAVFERESDRLEAPLARLLGAFSASEDADNPLGQRADGSGFTRAIGGTLRQAKLQPRDVAIVKTHGTGTDLNNRSERAGLEAADLRDFVATSFKPAIGHTMGASGLLETILLFEHMRKGEVPAIANRTERDETFLSQPCPVPPGTVLALAAGMGRIFSAAAFRPL
ncbi:hypothetical protein LAZ40_03330 [Cereibacter sphaeroides]|uniref:beta-ketoacyl synthase N-terminal-like domain-containing protein n=1 Tax=Cereibacter sphaeroides TaxID=1063 RepID=UPI001F1A78C4|nr:beta-ketoacyl synthase N-terminal-like domain-containing protein [Cereibacter sphaeroides]MCE6958088.1 hypothetical protein [Cereibacter sphaeroides]MCE6971425.1 hypothetical protein [Cereibacter sphaeroides]